MLARLKYKIFMARRFLRVMTEYLEGSLTLSYSQEGEDLILARLFDPQETGFYVDVGAYSPKSLSNTYLFYTKGWRGINIDARPGSMAQFAQIRPRDINLEFAISDCPQKLTYYMFNAATLNGFSEGLSNARAKSGSARLIGTKDMLTRSLAEVLREYLPAGQRIDFLTVDVEGFDLRVLQSNDWSTFRPTLVLAEVLPSNAARDSLRSPIAEYLAAVGYETYAKAANTLFFKDTTQTLPYDELVKRDLPRT
jgi:FkbM family methyltransferase